MKFLLCSLLVMMSLGLLAQPVNDDCSSAIAMDANDRCISVSGLEVVDKLDGLVLHSNPIEADKLIKNIVEGVDQLGANSVYILNKIKAGGFDDIPGYEDLIKGIKKSNDINSNVAHEVRQTFQKLDLDSNIPNETVHLSVSS